MKHNHTYKKRSDYQITITPKYGALHDARQMGTYNNDVEAVGIFTILNEQRNISISFLSHTFRNSLQIKIIYRMLFSANAIFHVHGTCVIIEFEDLLFQAICNDNPILFLNNKIFR